MPRLFQAIPQHRVRLSARAYLQLTREDRANIAKVRIIPPRPGYRDFGGFEVTYRRPVYEARIHDAA